MLKNLGEKKEEKKVQGVLRIYGSVGFGQTNHFFFGLMFKGSLTRLPLTSLSCSTIFHILGKECTSINIT